MKIYKHIFTSILNFILLNIKYGINFLDFILGLRSNREDDREDGPWVLHSLNMEGDDLNYVCIGISVDELKFSFHDFVVHLLQ